MVVSLRSHGSGHGFGGSSAACLALLDTTTRGRTGSDRVLCPPTCDAHLHMQRMCTSCCGRLNSFLTPASSISNQPVCAVLCLRTSPRGGKQSYRCDVTAGWVELEKQYRIRETAGILFYPRVRPLQKRFVLAVLLAGGTWKKRGGHVADLLHAPAGRN